MKRTFHSQLLIVALLLGAGPLVRAAPVTVTSTGFGFDLTCTSPNSTSCVVTQGDAIADKLGDFGFPAPIDTSGHVVTAMSLTMRIIDGDTEPGEIDHGHLFAGLQGNAGIVAIGSSFAPTDPLALSGFPDGVAATATNSFDLTPFPALQSSVRDLLAASTGNIALFILDQDEGGNVLRFDGVSPSNFQLSFDLAPIPLPAAAVLFAPAVLLLARWRRG